MIQTDKSSNMFLKLLLFALTFLCLLRAQSLMYACVFLGLLLIKEAVQYFDCKRLGETYVLPFFIPFPFPFGSLGSFSLLEEPYKKSAHTQIIFSRGLILSSVLALVCMAVGLSMTKLSALTTEPGFSFYFSDNLVSLALKNMFSKHAAGGEYLMFHPLYLAGFGVLLCNAMSALPIGQLNGGHIMHSVYGSKYTWTSGICCALLFALGFVSHYAWLLIASVFLLFTYKHFVVDYDQYIEAHPKSTQKATLGLLALIVVLGLVPSLYYFA